MISNTLVAAVIGSPVSHSLSPAMYRAVFANDGVEGTYEAIECSRENLKDLMAQMRDHHVRGVSVTMPLKEEILAYLDQLSDTAELLQAVNCVVFDGQLAIGHNTDGDGCYEALIEQGSAEIGGARVIVLGAGGTGRSVALALGKRGADVVVVNRTVSRTRELIERLGTTVRGHGGSVREGTFADIPRAEIIVNTTSVGMNSRESPIPLEMLTPAHVVLDAVYQPMETTLLAAARSCGAVAIDGLWMLVHQARRQYALQFGSNPTSRVMREAAERELLARRQ